MTPFLVAATLMLLVFGTVGSLAAQTLPDDWLERLHRERLQAAETALAEVRVVAPPAPSVTLPAAEPAPVDIVPLWPQRLSPEMWRLLQESFEAEAVPVALLAMGWVESRFESLALSPKGARGPWQFMPATARRYGLAVSTARDDRTDLARSTRAAARHLADLYQQFGDWLLALAAYNAGAVRVEAAIARTGSHNFWELRPWLPAETQDYVPAVLAATGTVSTVLASGPEVSPTPAVLTGRILYASPILPSGIPGRSTQ